jgi:hypothetical protein
MPHPHEPINFFFCYDENDNLYFSLNGSHYPDRNTIIEMATLLEDLLLIDDDEMEKRQLKITENQKVEREQMIEENSHIKIREPKEGYIYLVKSLGLYKIGRCLNSDSRIKTYRTENPHKIDLIFTIKVSDYIGVEKALLKKYEAKKYKGEWFHLSLEDISDIKNFLRIFIIL